MGYFCFRCGAEQDFGSGVEVGRRAECSKCRDDLHVCRNCRHYDESAYNQCRETQAERVVTKDRSNACDYFDFANRTSSTASPSSDKKDYLKELDRLFK